MEWGARTYLMGVVNATPDSFSGDGLTRPADAIERAVQQIEAGCDILDIGGESTRPGHVPVDPETEIARVVPVVAGVRDRFPGVVLSVDTYKPEVLRAAHAAGADLLNSVWGLPQPLLEAAVECGVSIAVMHNQTGTTYEGDMVECVLDFLARAAERAVRAGVPRERILLDPGIGFGKTADQNIAMLQNLHRVCRLGFPTLVGTSRKSTIGKLTGREPADRAFGTAATIALSVAAGVDVVRVHDVKAMRDVTRVSDAIVREWRPQGWT